MSVDKALKVLPDIFSLKPNDYSAFLTEESVNKGFQKRWNALGNRLHNAAMSIDSNKIKLSELEVEILTTLVLNSVRKELTKAIDSSNLDAASIDIDKMLKASGIKTMVEVQVRSSISRDDSTGAFKERNDEKNNHAHVMVISKGSNDKKEALKRA